MRVRLKSEDYDVYRILIPVKNLFYKRKQFVTSQLEKMHPCFSDQFQVDEKLKITKKGFCTKAVVIDKFILNGYKIKNGEGRFSLEDGTKVFGKKRSILVLIVLFVMLLSSIVLFLSRNIKGKELPEVLEEEIVEEIKEPAFVVFELFEKIKESGVSVTSFHWGLSINGEEELSVKISGDSRSRIEDLILGNYGDLSPVAFKDEALEFSIHSIGKTGVNPERKKTEFSKKGFLSEFRQIIENYSGKLKNMDYKKESLSFSVPVKSIMGNKFWNDINCLFDLYELFIYEFDIQLTSDGNAFVSIKTGQIKNRENYEKFRIIEKLMPLYSSLFFSMENKKSEEVKKTDQLPVKNDLRKKIGTVDYGNGKRLTFYKNEKGKIESERNF